VQCFNSIKGVAFFTVAVGVSVFTAGAQQGKATAKYVVVVTEGAALVPVPMAAYNTQRSAAIK